MSRTNAQLQLCAVELPWQRSQGTPRALERIPLRTQASTRLAVFDFIEGWYNPLRRDSAFGYLSPVEFERTSAASKANRPLQRRGIDICTQTATHPFGFAVAFAAHAFRRRRPTARLSCYGA